MHWHQHHLWCLWLSPLSVPNFVDKITLTGTLETCPSAGREGSQAGLHWCWASASLSVIAWHCSSAWQCDGTLLGLSNTSLEGISILNIVSTYGSCNLWSNQTHWQCHFENRPRDGQQKQQDYISTWSNIVQRDNTVRVFLRYKICFK